jgi:hypothetical protein
MSQNTEMATSEGDKGSVGSGRNAMRRNVI